MNVARLRVPPRIFRSSHHGRLCSRSVTTTSSSSSSDPECYKPVVVVSTAEDKVSRLAAKPLQRLTLKDLIRFGRPPLSREKLLSSARITREALPIGLSRRILALRNLPFIIVSNPYISSIYNNYLHSLDTILSFPNAHPTTMSEEVKFTELLNEIVQTHSNTIPTLAKGFLQCRHYISPAEVTAFLDDHLRARIGTRLMAEQHIALHFASPTSDSPDCNISPEKYQGVLGESFIGTLDTSLRPADTINSCSSFVGDICELRYGVRPLLTIDGNPDVTFPYIPVHLEYIITELLKNAFRATIEAGSTAPIIVTIAASPDCKGVTIRIRDEGGGIPPENLGKIWSYSFSTFDRESSYEGSATAGTAAAAASANTGSDDILARFSEIAGAGGEGSSIAGLGYGLPLSRAYAEYFDGSLSLQSAFGWGTDVYLTLRSVGLEGL